MQKSCNTITLSNRPPLAADRISRKCLQTSTRRKTSIPWATKPGHSQPTQPSYPSLSMTLYITQTLSQPMTCFFLYALLLSYLSESDSLSRLTHTFESARREQHDNHSVAYFTSSLASSVSMKWSVSTHASRQSSPPTTIMHNVS